jgi:hypothetical protein
MRGAWSAAWSSRQHPLVARTQEREVVEELGAVPPLPDRLVVRLSDYVPVSGSRFDDRSKRKEQCLAMP